jgi:hypothetical protein
VYVCLIDIVSVCVAQCYLCFANLWSSICGFYYKHIIFWECKIFTVDTLYKTKKQTKQIRKNNSTCCSWFTMYVMHNYGYITYDQLVNKHWWLRLNAYVVICDCGVVTLMDIDITDAKNH